MKKEQKKLSLKKIKIVALTKLHPADVKLELLGKKRCHWTQIQASCGTSFDLC
jgi:hypothetical protein